MENTCYWLNVDYQSKKYWYLMTVMPKTEEEAREKYFNFWDLEICEPLKIVKEFEFETYIKGEKARFNLFNTVIPLVSKDVLDTLELFIKNIEYFPVTIDGEKSDYYLLNILNEVDCIDRENSKVKMSKDPYDKTGKRKIITQGRFCFKFDKDKEYPYIFRVKHANHIIGVSHKMREILESLELKELVYNHFYTIEEPYN